MATRRSICVLALGLVLAADASAAQVGPPVGADASLQPGMALEPERQRQQHAEDPASASQMPPTRAAESDIPLMAAPRQNTPGEPSAAPAGGGWTRSLASVALVVGLILVLAAVVRFVSRRSGSLSATLGPGGRAPSGVLEVLARYPVARGQVLVLLRVDRRVLLLSQTVGGKSASFTTLAQFDDPSEVAAILQQTRDEASESVSARFRQALERFQGENSGVERGEVIEVGPRGEPLPKGRGVWA